MHANSRYSSLIPALAAATFLSLAALAAVAADAHAGVAQAAAVPVPVTPTLGAAGEGRRLYLRLNCYGCHGMAAAGGMGPNIVHAEMGDVSEALRSGEDNGMRSYATYVNSTDIANIAAYLASIGTPAEPKFRDWWMAIPRK